MGPIPSMSLSACAKTTPKIYVRRNLLNIQCYQKSVGMEIRKLSYGLSLWVCSTLAMACLRLFRP